MNYIKEMNAFYDWLEINELSSSAINLWYALMHINNKAGWAETFTVAESVLCVKTGLTDRTLRKVRNELKQKGRIDFTSRKGGKTPIYKIISFECSEIKSGDSAEGRSKDSTEGGAGDRSTLIKRNETKQNIEDEEDALVFFDKNIARISEHVKGQLLSWIDDKGEEIVIAAIKLSAENGATTYAYVKKILIEWHKESLQGINQVRHYEKRKHNKKSNIVSFKKKVSDDDGYDYGF
ncbi:DnaD domain-containing protein [Lentibacillus amyloliquefaciens]|uniref:DnaB/C C-terminal domain-containing protein n=1 Tax=Lentibacillus amyloliquefaciens TaxID=1472767 RepID=A0A0U3W2V0_9BACI|nr:DnaD domain protein [Lentibacillus amyloliquefaciens]ALX47488.1 hypothetical protein AOX59_02045 [Lentibacillus amyloliquefaciens]